MDYRIVEKPGFQVVAWGLRTTSQGGKNQQEIPAFWGSCHAQGKVNLLARFAGALGMLGICCEMDNKSGEFTYLIAAEAPAPGTALPEGTRTFDLPSARYAVFGSVGPMPGAIQQVWGRIFSEWLPVSEFEHAGTPDFEVYPAFPPGDPRGDINSPQYYSEVWIPVRARS